MSGTPSSSSPPASTETRISAVDPPPGVVPNFDNPPDAGHNLTLVTANVCIILIGVLVLVRAYVKAFIMRQIMLEDGKSFLMHAFSSSDNAVADNSFLKWPA